MESSPCGLLFDHVPHVSTPAIRLSVAVPPSWGFNLWIVQREIVSPIWDLAPASDGHAGEDASYLHDLASYDGSRDLGLSWLRHPLGAGVCIASFPHELLDGDPRKGSLPSPDL